MSASMNELPMQSKVEMCMNKTYDHLTIIPVCELILQRYDIMFDDPKLNPHLNNGEKMEEVLRI